MDRPPEMEKKPEKKKRHSARYHPRKDLAPIAVRFHHAPLAHHAVYDDPRADRIYKYRLLGLSAKQIAALFNIPATTFQHWIDGGISNTEQIVDAWEKGGADADAAVAFTLFRRAMGYEYVTTKEMIAANGERTIIRETVHVPGNAAAQKFWLESRQAENWQEKLTVSRDESSTPVLVLRPVPPD